MQFEMEELLEQANEVQETLSRSYAVPDEIDEVDLAAGAPSFYTLPFHFFGSRLETQNWKHLSWRRRKDHHILRILTRRRISSTKLPSKPPRFALEFLD